MSDAGERSIEIPGRPQRANHADGADPADGAEPAADTPLRLAFFGGTFDPPHRAHVAVARAAAEAFALNRVLFAPAGRQPLKQDLASAPFSARLDMVALTCAADARFAASTLDAPRVDHRPNYTVEALAALRRLYPEAVLFNLVGADSFQNLARWQEPDRLLQLADWIVVSRPGVPLAEPIDFPLSEEQRRRVHSLDTIHDDVSATLLRNRLHHGHPCLDLLPPGVAEYIARHHLYR